MTKIDQFESLFRSSAHDVYAYAPVELRSILVVTDLGAEAAGRFADRVKSFATWPGGGGGEGGAAAAPEWTVVAGEEFASTEDLKVLVERAGPDLVCTYRNLHSRAWRFPHSLGSHLDVLLQQTSVPVMVLPHPEAGYAFEHALEDTDTVMVATDHLANDHRLVNYALRFTQPGGTLFLMHIEDDVAFARYLDAIGKIPAIDTDEARRLLRAQLLKGPRDYAESCQEAIAAAGIEVAVEPVVEFGHRLAWCREQIESRKIDLLVMNTKDQDQLAMHGLAYPLAVELRQIPLLML